MAKRIPKPLLERFTDAHYYTFSLKELKSLLNYKIKQLEVGKDLDESKEKLEVKYIQMLTDILVKQGDQRIEQEKIGSITTQLTRDPLEDDEEDEEDYEEEPESAVGDL